MSGVSSARRDNPLITLAEGGGTNKGAPFFLGLLCENNVEVISPVVSAARVNLGGMGVAFSAHPDLTNKLLRKVAARAKVPHFSWGYFARTMWR